MKKSRIKGWTAARRYKVGDRVRLSDGSVQVITDVSRSKPRPRKRK